MIAVIDCFFFVLEFFWINGGFAFDEKQMKDIPLILFKDWGQSSQTRGLKACACRCARPGIRYNNLVLHWAGQGQSGQLHLKKLKKC